jgi:hypothetical protein
MKNKKINPREFTKLLKLHTNESYKDYVKAQKNYLSVLKKFIKQEIATKNDYQERYDSSAVCCLGNQWLPDWAYFEDLNNEIKVLNDIIGGYEFELLNPEEFEGEI